MKRESRKESDNLLCLMIPPNPASRFLAGLPILLQTKLYDKRNGQLSIMWFFNHILSLAWYALDCLQFKEFYAKKTSFKVLCKVVKVSDRKLLCGDLQTCLRDFDLSQTRFSRWISRLLGYFHRHENFILLQQCHQKGKVNKCILIWDLLCTFSSRLVASVLFLATLARRL